MSRGRQQCASQLATTVRAGGISPSHTQKELELLNLLLPLSVVSSVTFFFERERQWKFLQIFPTIKELTRFFSFFSLVE